jgi:hypothetical protein
MEAEIDKYGKVHVKSNGKRCIYLYMYMRRVLYILYIIYIKRIFAKSLK